MTKGIKVISPYEIEYFCGIDVNDLHKLPSFTSVRADWPRYPDEPTVVYNIDARYERKSGREVRLIVDYDYYDANNRELAERHPDISWGTNTIILKAGKQKGCCKWLIRNETSPETVHWEAFDLEMSHGRPARPTRDQDGKRTSGASSSPGITIAASSLKKRRLRHSKRRTSCRPETGRTTCHSTASRSGPISIACSMPDGSPSTRTVALRMSIRACPIHTVDCCATRPCRQRHSIGWERRSCSSSSAIERVPPEPIADPASAEPTRINLYRS